MVIQRGRYKVGVVGAVWQTEKTLLLRTSRCTVRYFLNTGGLYDNIVYL